MAYTKYLGFKNDKGSEVVGTEGYKTKSGRSKTRFIVKCFCGKEFKVIHQHFLSGATVSCGCARESQYLDLTGQTINKLKVLEMLPALPWDKRGNTRARVICTCGNEFVTKAFELKRKRVKSCGCALHSSMFIRRSNNKGISTQDAVWNYYYKSYINSAKTRNLDFNLTLEIFKEICVKNCFYCKSSPAPKNRYKKDIKVNSKTLEASTVFMNGIDRLNSNKGYEVENCVPCCIECNYHKGTYSVDQFKSWISRINANGFMEND